jgi:hypothetical protein
MADMLGDVEVDNKRGIKMCCENVRLVLETGTRCSSKEMSDSDGWNFPRVLGERVYISFSNHKPLD